EIHYGQFVRRTEHAVYRALSTRFISRSVTRGHGARIPHYSQKARDGDTPSLPRGLLFGRDRMLRSLKSITGQGRHDGNIPSLPVTVSRSQPPLWLSNPPRGRAIFGRLAYL